LKRVWIGWNDESTLSSSCRIASVNLFSDISFQLGKIGNSSKTAATVEVRAAHVDDIRAKNWKVDSRRLISP